MNHFDASAEAQFEALEDRHLQNALASAGLIDDTDDEAGVIFPLPEGAQIVRIVAGYDTRKTTDQKVRCSACRQHQPHYRGFRVELDIGHHARIGFDCGEKHFGIGTWQSAVADFDRRAENALYISRIEPAILSIEKTVSVLKEWHRRTNIFGSWIISFRQEVPTLFARLADEAKLRDGRLERQRRVKLSSVNRQGEAAQKTAYETILIGRIPFPGMFQGSSPNHGLNSANTHFGLASALLENKRDTASLAKAFRHIQDARQQLQHAAEVHIQIRSNLNLDWLPSLCDWASRDEQLEATYRAVSMGLLHGEHGPDEIFEFIDREAIGLPMLGEIDIFW